MSSPPRVAGLVLAAGAGRRFDAASAKQLAAVDGRPLLEHALAAAAEVAAAGGLARVAVALGARAREIAAAVDLREFDVVPVLDWEEGLAASLRAGVAALAPYADAIVVLLGDQPRVPVDAIARVAACGTRPGAPAARALYADGRPGHPVLLRRELFAAVGRLRGDSGARELLRSVEVEPVPCEGPAPRDVDRVEDLDAVRSRDSPG